MDEKNKGKVFILVALLGMILIPFIKAKPPEEEELGAEIINIEYKELI